MKKLSPLLLAVILYWSCQSTQESSDPKSMLDAEELGRHTQILSSDEYEGRAPSSPGEEKTIAYLEQQFKTMGVEPGNGDSYFQEVPLAAITASPDITLSITQGNEEQTYAYPSDVMVWTKRVEESVSIDQSELVFVGYGTVAPEFGWNDYEGIDVSGKTVLMVVNDPGYVTQDESVFNGNSMTYYGRWTYKFEEAARQGAAGALIIHQKGPAGYPWEVVSGSWSGKQFDLVTEDGNASRCAVEGWVTEAVAQKLFDNAGLNMDEMLAQAAQPGFSSQPLNQQASITLNNEVEKSVSTNVIAKLTGTTRPKEYIIYTAHWDHLGKDTSLEGDQIYNGAFDNATGTAGLLELAQAFKATGGSQRTILFLAVTAEEKGLLGSAYYARNPVYPNAQTVATLNMDGLNVLGPMKDITIVGYGNSELDGYAEKAAQSQGRRVRPDPQPEKGYYFRSDHFSFAKQGVPSLYLNNGIDHETKGEEWTRQQQDDYTANRYHKPADEYDPNWDLSGAIQDLQLLYDIGDELANSEIWPNWNQGVAFKATRDAQRR